MTKLLASATAALALTLAGTTFASAMPQNFQQPLKPPGPHLPGPGFGKPMGFKAPPYKPGPVNPGHGYAGGYGKGYWKGHGKHYGYGGAAVGFVGGMALGAIAASAAQPVAVEGECYTVRRRYVDAYGDLVIRRVQICE